MTPPDTDVLQRTGADFHALNAMLNLYVPDGNIQFEKDREAARQYFLQHVNSNTVFFHSLREKMDYLVENNYYEPGVLEQYDFSFVESLSEQAYAKKFRFPPFLGAFKYYTSYTLKTFDGERYLERFEDRVMMWPWAWPGAMSSWPRCFIGLVSGRVRRRCRCSGADSGRRV